MSAMSVAILLMQVPSGIGGNAATLAFATCYRMFGSAINRLRSVVFEGSLVLSFFLRFGADLCGVLTFMHPRLKSVCLQRKPADINAADKSAVSVLCQDII